MHLCPRLSTGKENLNFGHLICMWSLMLEIKSAGQPSGVFTVQRHHDVKCTIINRLCILFFLATNWLIIVKWILFLTMAYMLLNTRLKIPPLTGFNGEPALWSEKLLAWKRVKLNLNRWQIVVLFLDYWISFQLTNVWWAILTSENSLNRVVYHVCRTC